jgi:heptosyltransferase I
MMSALGDAVHVLPVVTALKRHSPASQISWVLQGGPASLVRGHHAVDEIIPFERKAGWRALSTFRRSVAGRSFDLVLTLQTYFKAGFVTAMLDAPVKLGFDFARARDLNWLFTTHRIPPHAPQHVQDQYFEFLRAIGVPHEPVDWALGPWPHERPWQRQFESRFDRPIVSLVIGSSRPDKDWVPERWAELADALYFDYGLEPVLVGGRTPSELATAAIIEQRARHGVSSTLGGPLREAVSIFDSSALVISLDTGPLHMSVALNRPVIALIGQHNPKRVGPYRRFHDLIVDAYGDSGEDYAISMQQRPGRVRRITVADVLKKVEVWRTRYASELPAKRSAPNS